MLKERKGMWQSATILGKVTEQEASFRAKKEWHEKQERFNMK